MTDQSTIVEAGRERTPLWKAADEVGSSTRTARTGRAAIARERAGIARAMLGDCHFCAHECGANRLEGEQGPCRAGAQVRYFSAQTEVADELELIPTFAIALSGCDLRCAFCITGAESWNPRAGEMLEPTRMGERARRALDHGARSVMILGGEPTVHLHAALDLVAALPDSARLVWKTNAHGSAAARELLAGMFDVWVADYKFGNDACAREFSGVDNYQRVVRQNLIWAAVDSDLIVRHLVMPGHIDCCWRPVARWLRSNLPTVRVNVRTGFWPAWRSNRHPDLLQPISTGEEHRVRQIAEENHLRLVK